MAKAKLLEQVKGLGDVYLVRASFDEQLSSLNEMGIKYPISVRDASYLRLHGQDTSGIRTCHAPILAKNSPVIIARISPLVEDIEMARQAVDAHRKGEYPSFSADVYSQWNDIAEKDKSKKPENRRAIILTERRDYRIHRDSDEARFFWRDTREKYFARFVSGDSIPSWQVNPEMIDSQAGTIVNYTWFSSPEDESDLAFRGGYLYSDDWAFGVLKKPAKAGSQKISEGLPYTKADILRISKIIDGVRKGDLPASKLERALQFLDKLK